MRNYFAQSQNVLQKKSECYQGFGRNSTSIKPHKFSIIEEPRISDKKRIVAKNRKDDEN